MSKLPLHWRVARGLSYAEGERRQIAARDDVADAWARGAEPFGVLLQNEFAPTITLGRAARPGHLLADADTLARHGYALHEARRGGDVTGHGPGQWTVYPVVPLKAVGGDLHRYLRALEEGVIAFLAGYGLAGTRREGLTGVWLGREKVAAVGVAVSRWVTWHGVAVNIAPESTAWTRWVVPCGIGAAEGGVTSLSAALDRTATLDETARPLAEALAGALGLRPTVPATPAIRRGGRGESDELAALWLRSVRATHAFLSEPDIAALLPEVRRALAGPGLWVIEADGGPAGFMLLDGDRIEALFIDPARRGGGLGTALLDHARRLDAGRRGLRVDVNEQNPAALAFYQARGFTTAGRSPVDGAGRPFPLLHLVRRYEYTRDEEVLVGPHPK